METERYNFKLLLAFASAFASDYCLSQQKAGEKEMCNSTSHIHYNEQYNISKQGGNTNIMKSVSS